MIPSCVCVTLSSSCIRAPNATRRSLLLGRVQRFEGVLTFLMVWPAGSWRAWELWWSTWRWETNAYPCGKRSAPNARNASLPAPTSATRSCSTGEAGWCRRTRKPRDSREWRMASRFTTFLGSRCSANTRWSMRLASQRSTRELISPKCVCWVVESPPVIYLSVDRSIYLSIYSLIFRYYACKKKRKIECHAIWSEFRWAHP